MELKHDHEDFCYIIRNGQNEIKVLIKRLSEFHHAPYRMIPIENFGATYPIKTSFKPSEEKYDEESSTPDAEGFVKSPKKSLSANFLPEEEIFERVSSFLDSFLPVPRSERV